MATTNVKSIKMLNESKRNSLAEIRTIQGSLSNRFNAFITCASDKKNYPETNKFMLDCGFNLTTLKALKPTDLVSKWSLVDETENGFIALKAKNVYKETNDTKVLDYCTFVPKTLWTYNDIETILVNFAKGAKFAQRKRYQNTFYCFNAEHVLDIASKERETEILASLGK